MKRKTKSHTITTHKGGEMKYLDRVKLKSHAERYKDDNIFMGDIGSITEPMILDDEFYIEFDNDENGRWYKYASVKIEDLEFIEDSGLTDDEILEDMPKHDPRWWCKVEDGYILNLLGERKNKIPYDYNS